MPLRAFCVLWGKNIGSACERVVAPLCHRFAKPAPDTPEPFRDSVGVQSVQEAYYATKTALWCYILSTWDISKLGINPNLSGGDKEAAERVLQAAKDIYTRGMRWNKLVEPKLTAIPDRDTAYAATVNGESVFQQVFTVTSETWSIEPVMISLAEGAPSGAKILDMNNNEFSSLNINDATEGNGYSWAEL